MSLTREIQCPYCGETLEYATEVWEQEYEAQRKLLKNKAHKAFDAIWKTGIVERNLAYSWLADELGVPYEDCHFSNFDIDQLKRVLNLCEFAKAKMLKAFCETTWRVERKTASLPIGNWGRFDFQEPNAEDYTPKG